MIVAVDVPHELWRAISFTLGMTWEILWALVLGFLLSAIVQALVPKERVERLLPDDSPRSLATATALGVASSSCSYASVALARTLFRKGADFTASKSVRGPDTMTASVPFSAPPTPPLTGLSSCTMLRFAKRS